MKKIFRVAHVGCGVISDNHIDALVKNESVELVALCDIIAERAERKREHYGIECGIYTDYVTMLDEVKPDAVHIATPHHLHCDMVCEALARDINVFLEKPMCINREQIDRLISAERNSKGRVCVCFQNRFNPATVYAQRVIDEDGGALCAYGSLFWKRNAEYYAQDDWRGKAATEGGGVMINQFIHTLDLLCIFLGIPKKVCASVSNHSLKGVIDVEDSCEGVIEFESGRRASFSATNAYTGKDFTTVLIETKNHRIEIRTSHLYVDDERIDDADGEIPSFGKACYGAGHGNLIGMFYDALKTGAEMPVTLDTAQHAVRILLAAYESGDRFVNV